MEAIIYYCQSLLQKRLTIDTVIISLFQRAFTHESFDPVNSYERLELLGDSVLGYVIGDYVGKRFPKQNESFLTEMKIKIVNSNMLSWLCRCTKLNTYIRITENINPNKIYEDVFEAFLGAFYIAYGIHDVAALIITIIENPNFVDFTELIINDYNYKKKLMITLQKTLDGRLPVFHTLYSQDSYFYVVVCHPNGKVMGVGVSKTIKLAQQSACKMALEKSIPTATDSDHVTYQRFIDRKRFEKLVDTDLNENNVYVVDDDILSIWNRFDMGIDKINQLDVYQSSFIHKSYSSIKDPRFQRYPTNEKLNFFGNSILMYLITDYLYIKYPQENEGYLTKIKTSEIQTKNLFSYCLHLGLNKHLVLAKSDESSRFLQNYSEQLFCSFLAAMTIDQGIDKVRTWIFRMWTRNRNMVNVTDENYKHQLLLKIQDNVAYKFYKYPYPTYRIVGSETNFEKKEFCIEVMDPNGQVIGKGLGRTKKDAEQDASRDALEKIAHRNVQSTS